MIAKESAALRQAFKEQDGTYRHRCALHMSSAAVGEPRPVDGVSHRGRLTCDFTLFRAGMWPS